MFKNVNFNDRLAAANEAKKARLAKFQPKPTVVAPEFISREEEKAAERERIRLARLAEKEAREQARQEAEQAKQLSAAEAEEAALEAKRAERKARKAAVKAEAKAKREMKKLR